ncbi:hypothetical protein PR001_g141 [Phytophthora rubi]|nr:hypothetical protein PR001_g141 [Phytophthora rubi]
MKLTGYSYDIEHINGTDNHWADKVSRWLCRQEEPAFGRVKAVRTRSSRDSGSSLRPLQDEGFAWPSVDEVLRVQQRHVSKLTATHEQIDMPAMWMSDQGTHFKNELMAGLRQRLKGVHTFVPVYTPWANGTVERLNRDILHVVRAVLLELQLGVSLAGGTAESQPHTGHFARRVGAY